MAGLACSRGKKTETERFSMKPSKIKLPQDENLHKKYPVEWWYFNGFLEGRKKYAFMHCLFKINNQEVKFLKLPLKTVYFSHSLLYDLSSKKVIKEVLPVVSVSEDSFRKKDFFVNYYYPLRKNFIDYEISRNKDKLKLKTKFLDLDFKNSKYLLENNNGFIKMDKDSTYYFSYPYLEAKGFIGKDRVKGISWMDRQWSSHANLEESWLWFSIQLEDNTQIFCEKFLSHENKALATISWPSGIQETLIPEITPLNKKWTSPRTGINYPLAWKIRVGKFEFITESIINDCEINFGPIHYWEGPIKINGKKARGFMEYLPKKEGNLKYILEKIENIPFDVEKLLEKI